MAYRLRVARPVTSEIKRVVREQIDRSIGELTDEKLDRHEAVHQARKRMKKVRGALRLVRGAVGKVYRRENAWFRDAARRLSDIRDAEAVIEAFDKLTAHSAGQIDSGRTAAVRSALVERREAIARRLLDGGDRTEELVGDLQRTRGRMETCFFRRRAFGRCAGV